MGAKTEKISLMMVIRILGWFVLIALFTVISQVGGIVLLSCIPVFRLLRKQFPQRRFPHLINSGVFLGIYLAFSLLLLPPLAALFNRVPLPVMSNQQLKPLNYFTCFFNRHYVNPKLKKTLEEVAGQMNEKYPGSVVAYLDANFPLFDKFPLIPHLSHDDGKKVDLAFFYQSKKTGQPLNRKAPSFIGYGVFEDPLPGESDYPAQCADKGYWQYSFMERIIPQGGKKKIQLDHSKTAALIKSLASHAAVGKIFLEPHLKERLNLTSGKVRYHGCHAVRHDDHIHIQL